MGKRQGSVSVVQAHVVFTHKHSTAQLNKATKHTGSVSNVTQTKPPHVLQGNNPTQRFGEEICDVRFTANTVYKNLFLLDLILDKTSSQVDVPHFPQSIGFGDGYRRLAITEDSRLEQLTPTKHV